MTLNTFSSMRPVIGMGSFLIPNWTPLARMARAAQRVYDTSEKAQQCLRGKVGAVGCRKSRQGPTTGHRSAMTCCYSRLNLSLSTMTVASNSWGSMASRCRFCLGLFQVGITMMKKEEEAWRSGGPYKGTELESRSTKLEQILNTLINPLVLWGPESEDKNLHTPPHSREWGRR
jgi:hypothetical protein